MKDTYHHGDLKQALIEKGLEYISEHGTETLSLRKLAAFCGVSNAAPYAHFADKDDLLRAIHDYIMTSFTDVLQKCISKNEPDMLCSLGVEYVQFFKKNPLYYSFLFSSAYSRMDISPKRNARGNVPPFELFKSIAYDAMDSIGIQGEDAENRILAMWALVHGLAGITASQMGGRMTRTKIRDIICSAEVI